MPIRPERQALYPANWKSEIVPMIRARSSDRCETCGAINSMELQRSICGNFYRYWFVSDHRLQGPVWSAASGERYEEVEGIVEWKPPITIILTVAHLNHDETDNRPENLAHLCQLHHNRHDAKHRAANASRTRKVSRET